MDYFHILVYLECAKLVQELMPISNFSALTYYCSSFFPPSLAPYWALCPCSPPHNPMRLIDLPETHFPGFPLALRGATLVFIPWSHAAWLEVNNQPAFHPIPTSYSQAYGECWPSSCSAIFLSLPEINPLWRERPDTLHTSQISNFIILLILSLWNMLPLLFHWNW